MFGMMTGTIGSGALYLRKAARDFATPAANNLVTGASFAILFGAPLLVSVGLVPTQPLLVLANLVIYMVFLLVFMLKFKRGNFYG
jgi:glutamate:Na+ symporter, ESS family